MVGRADDCAAPDRHPRRHGPGGDGDADVAADRRNPGSGRRRPRPAHRRHEPAGPLAHRGADRGTRCRSRRLCSPRWRGGSRRPGPRRWRCPAIPRTTTRLRYARRWRFRFSTWSRFLPRQAAAQAGRGGRVGVLGSPAVQLTGLFDAASRPPRSDARLSGRPVGAARGDPRASSATARRPPPAAALTAAARDLSARWGGRAARRLHRILARGRSGCAAEADVIDTLDVLVAAIVRFAIDGAQARRRGEDSTRAEDAALRRLTTIHQGRNHHDQTIPSRPRRQRRASGACR